MAAPPAEAARAALAGSATPSYAGRTPAAAPGGAGALSRSHSQRELVC